MRATRATRRGQSRAARACPYPAPCAGRRSGRAADSILGANAQQRLGAADGAYGPARFGASEGENSSAVGKGRACVPGALCGMWTSDWRSAGRGRALWACHRDRPRTGIRFTSSSSSSPGHSLDSAEAFLLPIFRHSLHILVRGYGTRAGQARGAGHTGGEDHHSSYPRAREGEWVLGG